MSSVRAFKASDGSLFEDYQAYVRYEESLKFNQLWDEQFAGQFDNEQLALEVKDFIEENADGVLTLLQASKVKKPRGRGAKQ